jgi:cation transport regulator ChaC
MMSKLGILAFGSLINHPGWEIEEAIIARKSGIRTPFGVEFARKSRKRAGAPTLLYRLIMVAVRSLGNPCRGLA